MVSSNTLKINVLLLEPTEQRSQSCALRHFRPAFLEPAWQQFQHPVIETSLPTQLHANQATSLSLTPPSRCAGIPG